MSRPRYRTNGIGQLLRERREMLGLSTREVAARTDGVITYAGLSRIEIGARYPRLRTLEALCEVLGITIEINSKGTRVKW